MGRYIVIFLLFGLPLFLNPFGMFAFEQPKVFLAQIAIEVLVVYAIYHYLKFKHFNKSLLYIVGAFFLLSFTSFLVIQGDLFFGNIFRLQGVFLFWHLLVLALIASKINFQVSHYIPQVSLLVLFVSGLFLQNNDVGRSVGTLGEPNALAASAIFIFPFAFLKGSKIEKAIALSLTIGILYLSSSHSGLIAFGIEVFYFLLLYSKKVTKQIALTICCLLIVLSLVLPFIEEKRVYEDRADIWYTSFFAGIKNPIFGNGFGTVEESIRQTSINLFNFVRFQKVDSAHNFLLDYWIQGGIVGIGLMMLLLWDTIRNFSKKSESYLTMAFLGVLTVMLFNPVSVVTLVAFWWLAGCSFFKNPEVA